MIMNITHFETINNMCDLIILYIETNIRGLLN